MSLHLSHPADFNRAQRCLEGDAEALQWLLNHLTTVIASRLIRTGAPPRDAAELCVSLATDLVMPSGERKARLALYSGTASLDTWLYTAAMRQWVDGKRKETRERRLMPQPLTSPDPEREDEEPRWMKDPKAPAGSDSPLAILVRDAVQSAFMRAHPEDFVLLLLSHIGELSGEKIAEMFQCDAGHISRRMKKAAGSIRRAALRHIREADPDLELEWEDFADLCRTMTLACFGDE